MASIIQAGQNFQNMRIGAAETAKQKTYDPATNFILAKLDQGAELLGKPISSMQNRQYQPVRGTGSFKQSAVNVAKNYDAFFAKHGEAASRYAGAGAYTVTKSILGSILSIVSLGTIERTNIGRAVIEGVSQAVGFTVRAVGLLATTILRALPYLAVAAGIAVGGWKLGVLAVAAVGLKAVLSVSIPAMLAIGYIAFNQVQIHVLGKKIDKLTDEQRRLMDKQNQPSRIATILRSFRDMLVKNKGRIATGAALGAGAAAAYYYGPDAAKAIASTDAYKATAAAVSPHVDAGIEMVKTGASAASDAVSRTATTVGETLAPVTTPISNTVSAGVGKFCGAFPIVCQGVQSLTQSVLGKTEGDVSFDPTILKTQAFAEALASNGGIASKAYAAAASAA